MLPDKVILPTIKELINLEIPIFGICLGHQIISLAFGAKTKKCFKVTAEQINQLKI